MKVQETLCDDPKGRQLDICVQPGRIFGGLVALLLVLALLGTLANICIYQVAPHPEHKLARFMHRFDLGHEPSIPAWYSSLALLACAVLLWVIGTGHRRMGRRGSRPWFALAVIFVLLAMDEAVMFHELLHNTLSDLLRPKGVFYFPWVIPGIIFVTIVAITFSRFLWNLEPRARWLFIAAGTVFVTGAVGMEMFAGVVVQRYTVASLHHTAVQTVEETLEMLGVVIFIYALLDYWQRNFGSVRISVSSCDKQATTFAKVDAVFCASGLPELEPDSPACQPPSPVTRHRKG